MKLTPSKLRQNLFRLLDKVIETGEPLEIERNGNILKIVPVKKAFSKLSKLKKRELTTEDSDNFIHIDWSNEWKMK